MSPGIISKRFDTIDALLDTIDDCERSLDELLGDPDHPSIYPSVIPPPPPALAPSADRLLSSMAEPQNEAALAMALAARIREARKAKGWRQQDLADATGIARPNIARIESGRRMPKITTLHRIGQALGLTLDSITP